MFIAPGWFSAKLCLANKFAKQLHKIGLWQGWLKHDEGIYKEETKVLLKVGDSKDHLKASLVGGNLFGACFITIYLKSLPGFWEGDVYKHMSLSLTGHLISIKKYTDQVSISLLSLYPFTSPFGLQSVDMWIVFSQEAESVDSFKRNLNYYFISADTQKALSATKICRCWCSGNKYCCQISGHKNVFLVCFQLILKTNLLTKNEHFRKENKLCRVLCVITTFPSQIPMIVHLCYSYLSTCISLLKTACIPDLVPPFY